MMDIETHIYRDVMTMTELIADAVIKRLSPMEDDLSQREAEARYGHRWIRHIVERGKVTPHRVGNKLIYSRHELDALRAVERESAKLITNSHKTR